MVTKTYKNSVGHLRGPSPRNLAAQNIKLKHDFGQLRDLIANISGTQQDIVVNRKTLQTTDNLTQANLMRCTLVHKQRKIGPTHRP